MAKITYEKYSEEKDDFVETEIEVSPCPHCHNEDIVINYNKNDTWSIICYKCGVEGPCLETEEDAVKAWNSAFNLQEKLSKAIEALDEISEWSQELQDMVELNNAGISMWRGCVATANIALKKIKEE